MVVPLLPVGVGTAGEVKYPSDELYRIFDSKNTWV